MGKIIPVDIIVFNPSILYRCVDCETIWREIETTHPTHMDMAVANLPTDLAHEYRVVSEWVAQTLDRFPNQIHLRVVDAISVEGVAKSTQYGINFYPAVVIDHHFVFSEGKLDQATEEISRMLEEPQHQHMLGH
jgi:hypothetical protein